MTLPVAADYPFLDVLWSTLIFMALFLWIWLAITCFADIFRRRDTSGWVKAIWCLFIIVLPYLGVFVYLIARGKKMSEHAVADAQAQDAAARAYIRDAAGSGGGGSPAAELERLASLRDQGVIDEAEFQALKAKALA